MDRHAPQVLASLTPDSGVRVDDLERTSISVGFVRSLVTALEASGVSAERYLRAAGLQRSYLDRPDERISFAECNRLRELAMDMTGREGLGLDWVTSLASQTLVPISHLASHSASLRQALELLARYVHVVSDRRAYDAIRVGDRILLRYCPVVGESLRLERCTAEMVLGGFFRFIQCFGVGPLLGAVRFSYAAPAYREEYTRFFGCQVHFDQPHSEIEFDIRALDAVSPTRDDEVRETIQALIEQRLVRIQHATSWAKRVRELILREGHSQRVDMETVARGLRVSERTLRRRLAEEGTSYDEVSVEARSSIAKQLLSDPERPIGEVAYELGFADPSTFHRAFKRWTGTTPKSFRMERLRANGA